MRAGHLIQILCAALLGLGVVMVHSAAMGVANEGLGFPDILMTRNTLFGAAALLAMVIAANLPWPRWIDSRSVLSLPVLGFVVAFALVGLTFVPGLGRARYGATRWLELGSGSMSLTFQPSELLKYSLVILLSWWCARQGLKMRSFIKGLVPALCIAGLAIGIVVLHDFGTAALMALLVCGVLLAGSARLLHLFPLLPIGALAGLVAIMAKPHRLERIQTFLDPFADMQGSGYQAAQGLVALAQGGLWGRGLGNGVQKFDYLPIDTSDMILAVIGEELGFVGVAAVIVAIIGLVLCGLQIVGRTRTLSGRLVVLGLTASVGLQALINVAVVLVVVPTKGMALPLVSAGGTGWIMTAFALGIVASFDHEILPEADSRSEGLPDSHEMAVRS